MRLLTFLFINLKQLIKQFPVTVIYMVGLPLGISLLMGFTMDIAFTNPNDTLTMAIKVVDEDESSLSQQLLNFFRSDEISDFVYLTEQNTAILEIVIPNGYGDAILNNAETLIDINILENGEYHATILEAMLKQYHEHLQTSLASGGSVDLLTALYEKPAIESVYIETPISLNSTTYYSIYMLGFFAFMMIMTFTNGGYKQAEMGLNKRMYAAPLSRVKMFIYANTVDFVYTILLLLVYVLTYRFLGYSFEGNFGLVLLCVLATSFFIVSIGSFIGTFFKAKYGNAIATGLFFLQVALGGSFFPTENIKYLSPSVIVTEMFNSIVLYDELGRLMIPLLITIGISAVFYMLSMIKIHYRLWEE